jgi:hypothetical protein
MMEFPDLPGWTFTVDEVSFGVFLVCCRYISGGIIRKTGTDPDALLEECRIEALEALNLAKRKHKA